MHLSQFMSHVIPQQVYNENILRLVHFELINLWFVFAEPESVNGSDVRSNISFQTQENPVVTFIFPEVSLRNNISLS